MAACKQNFFLNLHDSHDSILTYCAAAAAKIKCLPILTDQMSQRKFQLHSV